MIWQIIRKELWHNKLWMALTLAFILLFTTIIYKDRSVDMKYPTTRDYSENSEIQIWTLYNISSEVVEIRSFSAIYFFAAAGLGILIGINQFWVQFFTNTWKFTLHRPIQRGKMLALMLVSAAFMIALIAGGGWTVLWFKARSAFELPPTTTALAEGWLFTLEGFMVYLAVALAAVSQERWYTTKLYPLLFVLFGWIVMWTNITFTAAFITAGIYMAIVIPLIYRKFETREF